MAVICEKTISGKILSKKVLSIGTRGQEVNFPTKLLIFSRKYPVAEKLEQLERIAKSISKLI